jgi:hypothetical protein
LEIQDYTDPEHDPMIPHTLVLEPELIIHSVYNRWVGQPRGSKRGVRRPLASLARTLGSSSDRAYGGRHGRDA